MATTVSGALTIRPLDEGEPPESIARLARLLVDAYPIMRRTTSEAIAQFTEQFAATTSHPGTRYVVAERDGVPAGVMRLYDYVMNVRGRDALTGGVGSVAVSLAHKRQGIARALIAWYLDHYRERGAPFAILHPFRLDFYRALGFGYGTPVHRYAFAPGTLRDDGARGTIRFLGVEDLDEVHACDERARSATNGFIVRHRAATERALREASLRYVGVEDGGVLRGFMQTTVVVGGVPVARDDLRNRDVLVVRDFTYEDETYRAALLGYLRAQRDQFARVEIESQDAALYLASTDPRDGSDESVAPPAGHRIAKTGLGVMYRILDVERAFSHVAPSPVPFTLRAEVRDEFFSATSGTWTLPFGPHGAARTDATLTIGIADLSSVLVGSLRLRDVVRSGLATLEPRAMLDHADEALRAEPPICNARF